MQLVVGGGESSESAGPLDERDKRGEEKREREKIIYLHLLSAFSYSKEPARLLPAASSTCSPLSERAGDNKTEGQRERLAEPPRAKTKDNISTPTRGAPPGRACGLANGVRAIARAREGK